MRLVSALVFAVCSLALASCGGDDEGGDASGTSSSSSSATLRS
jgi:hypothetical protein